ncbi:S-methyl-5-thioribose-1-phosphate isomerase [Beggiatoa alba B18LD]|uniref:Methylthioribose-1-phosphate isomerase n=1 Tax=Beggiatoa alba B18LD TaxID=395493 RepID=I3CG05_9GAMM|nr:S-methyl-5-thioribose-1-phosphate isomerase [Beggiatoa alba]EIJ42548.1 S-methyl-5-thioribose-1-phosphate isomerase [Beggiatoa alba B18LD]
MTQHHDTLRAVTWQDNKLQLIDQRKLPHHHEILSLETAQATAQAIHDMVVRGAPAIGITAAYGVVLAAREAYRQSPTDWMALIGKDIEALANSRPTAVNLFWALRQMQALFPQINGDPEPVLLAAAQQIQQADIAANYFMGELGASYLPQGKSVLTHCNTGSLATGGYGTALGVIRNGYATGKIKHVYADETRPWLQGARLTAWELVQDQIPVTLLVEGAAAALMRQGQVAWVIVGADRITANGDVANKIGTYSLAVLARYHGIKFMVVAPSSTVDMQLATGQQIVIEERLKEEVLRLNGQTIAATGALAWNPVFDVTPAELIDVIITEKGAIENPTTEKMQAVFNASL